MNPNTYDNSLNVINVSYNTMHKNLSVWETSDAENSQLDCEWCYSRAQTRHHLECRPSQRQIRVFSWYGVERFVSWESNEAEFSQLDCQQCYTYRNHITWNEKHKSQLSCMWKNLGDPGFSKIFNKIRFCVIFCASRSLSFYKVWSANILKTVLRDFPWNTV